MMSRRFASYFIPSSVSGMEYLRKNFTLLLAFIVMASAIIGVLLQMANPNNAAISIQGNIISLAAGALGAWLVLKQRVTLAAFVVLIPLLFSTIFINNALPLLVLGMILVVGSAVTFPVGAFVTLFLLVVLRMGARLVGLLNESGYQYTEEVGMVATFVIVLIMIGSVTRFLIDTAIKLNRDSSRTAELLRGTSQVSQLLSGTLSQDELFARAVDAIRDRFAFYHVQIFLVDEQRQYANLVASTGEVGQKLLSRGHRLGVGSKSVIGRVTQIGEAVLMRDDNRDEIHMANEFLPHTRSELALPLIDNERIIGALDVQSTRVNAFSPSDIQAMQTLAGQLTTAIRNARLFEQQRESVQQNQQLLTQTQASLREIQRLNTQMTQRAWDEYLNEREDEVGVKIESEKVVSTADWTAEMIEAALAQRVTTRDAGNRVITAVPILLRGELLGVIEVEGENLQDEDVIEMVQAISQNLAITLDSVRLLEEVQSSAAQEQRISAIVDRYQSASSVDELMKVTLDELARTLGADQGTIRLSAQGQRKQAVTQNTVTQDGQSIGQVDEQVDEQAPEDKDQLSGDVANSLTTHQGSAVSNGANGSNGSSSSNGSGPADRRNGNISHD